MKATRALLHAAVVGLCAALAATLAWTMAGLPRARVQLAQDVAARLDASGVEHPVTAVLLNFRGYDTLLEVAVLLLALLGLLASGSVPSSVGRMAAEPVLELLARLLVPLMVMAAGYLLWAGAFRPGGAFQAAAVLAGAGVLLRLAGVQPNWTAPRPALRAALVAGFVVFLAVAVLGLAGGALLHYPPGLAGSLILAIEATLTVSLALTLAALFLLAPLLPHEGGEGGS